MSNKQLPLAGQWALITGAGKRIGACVAGTLHAQGANVAIHYRGSAAAAEALAAGFNVRKNAANALPVLTNTSVTWSRFS